MAFIESVLKHSIWEHSPPVTYVSMRPSVHQDFSSWLKSQSYQSICIVSDAHTHKALGSSLENLCSGIIQTHLCYLEGAVVADEYFLTFIKERAADVDLIVAVGSGTINDLCKYASFVMHKPYIVCPTAASMNGYCSANASLTLQGNKKSVSAHCPQAVFVDLETVASAPPKLMLAGVADLLCRVTVQLDLLLASHLTGADYALLPFTWVEPMEAKLLLMQDGLESRNFDAVSHLMEMLLVSGLGMTAAGSSASASQGEHMIAHLMDMTHKAPPSVLHAQAIAVTTYYMIMLYRFLWKSRSIVLRSYPSRDEARKSLKALELYGLDPAIISACLDSYDSKCRMMPLSLEKIVDWRSDMHVANQINHMEQVLSFMRRLNISVDLDSCGWCLEHFLVATIAAPFSRNRMTLLDVMGDDYQCSVVRKIFA